MKKSFKYTFITIAEWKKFLLVVLSVSILTLFESMPVISVMAFLFEKLIYLSIGVFLIYLLKHSSTIEIYFENLQKNYISTFLFHYIPPAIGILLGILIIGTFWFLFFIMIFEFTNSMFVFADPNNFLYAIGTSTFITKILIGFYLVYLIFFSYIFLGKFGEALSKTTFKESFISIISSLVDFKYWTKTFNLTYLGIYLIWSVIAISVYSVTSFIYLFIIFPAIATNPNISLIIIPVFVAITTILTYYTYFSSYFAYKSTIKQY
ncbi:MAG: hypothetical protein GWP10_13295 [Nitrospiraceae bacterium]|nr:hypothetical protein [Nitrospiraceae bacterium]